MMQHKVDKPMSNKDLEDDEAVDRLNEAPRYKITTAGIHTIARNGTELDRLVRSSIYHGFTPTIEVLRDGQPAPIPSR